MELAEILRCVDQANDVARQSFAAGDTMTALAALSCATQLVTLAIQHKQMQGQVDE